jgi:hypothetical protein
MNAPDLEALLVALVLAPATYSRNRFFSLYTDPEVRRVRRRASLIRSIVRHISSTMGAPPPYPHVSSGTRGETLKIEPVDGGAVALTYIVPSIGLRRTSILDPLELALVRFAVARAPKERAAAAALAPDDPDRLRIEAALVRLAPRAVPPSAPPV